MAGCPLRWAPACRHAPVRPLASDTPGRSGRSLWPTSCPVDPCSSETQCGEGLRASRTCVRHRYAADRGLTARPLVVVRWLLQRRLDERWAQMHLPIFNPTGGWCRSVGRRHGRRGDGQPWRGRDVISGIPFATQDRSRNVSRVSRLRINVVSIAQRLRIHRRSTLPEGLCALDRIAPAPRRSRPPTHRRPRAAGSAPVSPMPGPLAGIHGSFPRRSAAASATPGSQPACTGQPVQTSRTRLRARPVASPG